MTVFFDNRFLCHQAHFMKSGHHLATRSNFCELWIVLLGVGDHLIKQRKMLI